MSNPKPFSPVAVAEVAENQQQESGVAIKPPKKPSTTPNKVIGAKILLQYRGEDGVVYEAVTTIDPKDVKIQSYELKVEEKHDKKRDSKTKDILGFEDTGERVLVFKLRYHER